MISSIANFLLFTYFILLSLIGIYCFWQFIIFLQYIGKKKSQIRTKSSQELPFVTIQLPIYNEKNVIERLLDQVVKMDYPKHKFEIQVLDDSTDETQAITVAKIENLKHFGVEINYIHRQDRSGFKAGALKNGMETAKGDLICIFDADFLPTSDFLKKIIPYFAEKNVGVVQSRWGHLNENENLLTTLQSLQLNVHFTSEQGGRYKSDQFLQFNGTAGVWRKGAITEGGGWQADTLTEDLDLSYRSQMKGWKIVFLDELISPAELPSEMASLKSQQYRWMKGGAQTAKKLLPMVWKSNLTPFKKVHCTFHLLSSSVYLLVFFLGLISMPLMLCLTYVSTEINIFNYLFSSLPFLVIIYYYANVILSWNDKSIVKKTFKFIFIFPVFLCFTMGLSLHNALAVFQGWIGKQSEFVRTPKRGSNKKEAYTINISNSMFIEALLSVLFIGSVVFGLLNNNGTFVVMHSMLAIGYASVFILSLKSKLQ
jgi:cellulose synthase/poly-beta-1,6-N-acetylglucosamine synthase-like glycosyltransferase